MELNWFYFICSFQKFGEVEDVRDQDASSVVMTFRTRSDAENVREHRLSAPTPTATPTLPPPTLPLPRPLPYPYP